MSNFEYKVKRENPNDEFVIIGSWDYENGAEVSAGDILCTLEATKNNYDVEAPRDGYIFFNAQEGDRVEVGNLLFVISDDAEYKFEVARKKKSTSGGKITRKAQKLIVDYGIDAAVFAEADSRVGEKEVKAYIDENNLTNAGEESEDIGVAYTDEALTPAKEFEVHFMTQASSVIYSKVVREISNEVMEAAMKKFPGVTMGEIVAFGTIEAIKKFPYVNSYFAKNKIRKFEEYNLGLAINIGRGLKVPVLKGFSEMSLEEIANKFKETAMNYVRDELTRADLAGGTFTMTDLSSLGVKEFLPVVNKDQGAILGVCSMSENSKTFNLVLGFDHRIMDGMYAAQFLKAVEDSIKKISS